jgi:hypothetical protein
MQILLQLSEQRKKNQCNKENPLFAFTAIHESIKYSSHVSSNVHKLIRSDINALVTFKIA